MKILEFTNENDLNNLQKFGVYQISTNFNNKKYVGSTTKSFIRRWGSHLNDLKRKKHFNKALQNVVNKYGIGCLIFEIIEINNNKNNVIDREQHFIDFYDSYKNGYNNRPIASSTLGFIRSEEMLSVYYKKVSQYSMDGDFIKTFKSLKDGSIQTNTDYVTLSNVCNLKTKLANGYQWRFGENNEKIKPVRPKTSKSVLKYKKNGDFIETFFSIKDASETINRKPNTLSTAIKREVMCGGFFWKIKK